MAVFPLPERRSLDTVTSLEIADAAGPLVVFADGIGDPGNMGTLLRAAVAFGATALATAPSSVDLYGPKTVRAGMGAVFGLPLFPEVRLAEVLAALPGAAVYGLAAHEGVPLAAAGLRRPAVLVVGAERPGLSAEARAHVTQLITIPLAPGLPGGVESLNAGVAGAIALYELSRRPAAPAKG
jgi:TrmH family RNA methyltransferase